jgi:hypothetical protein
VISKLAERELTEEIQPRYLKSNKAEKEKILDQFTAGTGYNCKLRKVIKIKGLSRQNKLYENCYTKPGWTLPRNGLPQQEFGH